jgi:hypothetical protein
VKERGRERERGSEGEREREVGWMDEKREEDSERRGGQGGRQR